MFISAISYILFGCIISSVLCFIGYVVAFNIQSPEMAEQFLISSMYYFDGILIFGFSFGALLFVLNYYKAIPLLINKIIQLDDNLGQRILVYSKNLFSIAKLQLFAIPITLVGGTILWKCGYPLVGFSKLWLAFWSISIYYIGGLLLGIFYFTVKIFVALENEIESITVRKSVSYIDIDNFNMYYIISSMLGFIALYLSFRGTLTANFSFVQNSLLFNKKMLSFPIFIFLIAPIIHSFYPRYVIRRIIDNSIMLKVNALENRQANIFNEVNTEKEKLEIEKTIIQIKQNLEMDRSKLPLISLKDAPSIILIFMMILQYIVQNDNIVKSFINQFSQ